MNIHYGQVMLDQLYGISINDDTFEELALIAHNLIGNKHTRLYHYIDKVKREGNEYYIDLPCNVSEVEAVTCLMEDWQHVTNIDWNGDWKSHFTEQYIEHRKEFLNNLYISGKYLKYEHVGNRLYFHKNYGPVSVLYKGEILDDDGLPDVTEKEAIAIATYIAYIQEYKEGIKTMNPNIVQLARELRGEWNIKCDAARTPEYLNQNDMDEILDAKSSWNRKQFGKSVKPLR